MRIRGRPSCSVFRSPAAAPGTVAVGLGAGKPSKMIKKFDKKDEESGTRGAPDAHPQAQRSPPLARSHLLRGAGRSGGGSARSPSPGAGASPRAARSRPGCRLERSAAPPQRVPAPRARPPAAPLRAGPPRGPVGGRGVARACLGSLGLLVGLGPRASTPCLLGLGSTGPGLRVYGL